MTPAEALQAILSVIRYYIDNFNGAIACELEKLLGTFSHQIC